MKKITHQRPLNKMRVEKYAKLMKAGAWDESNPQGCTSYVSSEGNLMDSQHRLQAVVKSGVSLTWMLFEEVDPEARATMDRGRPWTGGDYLGSKGYANSNRIAAVTRVIHC